MTYDELISTIKGSSAGDWIHNDHRGVWTYKHDLMIHFKHERSNEDDRRDRLITEEWTQIFPDRTALLETYTIYYGDSFVAEVMNVHVDGHRTIMPLPKSRDNLVVTDWQYRFAKILDKDPGGPYALDERMRQAGFRVE